MIDDKFDTSEPKKNRKKAIIILALLLLAFLFTLGTVIAYFSDMVGKNGNVSTGNLKITATYTVFLNGTETAFENINDIAPGDTILIKGTITNTGKESAWVREIITINSANQALMDNLEIYDAELTQGQLLAGTDFSEFALELDDGIAISGSKVINAAGQGKPAGGSFDYIDADNYSFSLTVYFAHTAPNATQDQSFSFDISTQALQFRNNNADQPDEDAWATVQPRI